MNQGYFYAVCDILCGVKIGYGHKQVVDELITDVAFAQLSGQPVVAVKIDL